MRREAHIIHNFGRADQVDHAALRCLVRSITGMYLADNLGALSRGLGRYIQVVPMREVEGDFLTRPGGRNSPKAAKCDGKFVVITNDEIFAAEDARMATRGAGSSNPASGECSRPGLRFGRCPFAL